MIGLVLSLFPGIGMLDLAFEEEGFCVVRGPDLLWGGDVRKFSPPRGRFDGVIGGPPCQFASEMSRFNRHLGRKVAANLIPEFERIVIDASPAWFVMENVVQAPAPVIPGYTITPTILRDHWCGGETMRRRRMSIGMVDRRPAPIETLALHRADPDLAVTSAAREDRFGRPKHLIAGKLRVCGTRGERLPLPEMARRQGLPPHFFGPDTPFTVEAQRKMLGNGVPLAMGRAVARAVKAALA
jgi:DNA (cytosine-5)-methyltransferase 1